MLLPTTQASAAVWSPLVDLSGEAAFSSAAFATGDAGDGVAAWLLGDTAVGGVQAAVRNRSGDWVPALLQEPPPQPRITTAIAAASDARGGDVVTWVEEGGSTQTLKVGTHSRGAAPSFQVGTVATLDGRVAAQAVEVDRRGTITVAWVARGDGSATVRFAQRAPGEDWRTGIISGNADGDDPGLRLAVSRDSTLVAQWRGVHGRTLMSVGTGRGFGRVRSLPTRIVDPVATPVRAGRVLVVGRNRQRFGTLVLASTSLRSGAFRPPAIVAGCPGSRGLEVAPAGVDGFGRVTAAWSCARLVAGQVRTWIRTSLISTAGVPRPPVTVAVGARYGAIEALGVGVQGHSVVVWGERSPARRGLLASVRSRPLGPWTRAQRIPGGRTITAIDTHAGIDARGRAVVLTEIPETAVLASRRG